MHPFRALPDDVPATIPAPSPSEALCSHSGPIASIRTCVVCGKPIKGRAEKRSCSGRCRIVACRQRRHASLLERLEKAEAALTEAAEAVAALRAVAEGGPHVTATLAIGRGGKCLLPDEIGVSSGDR
ncbi:MAG: hypothetical protein ABSF69_27610 [Polyangiaceae bacterium]|jgi:hypothetical protein